MQPVLLRLLEEGPRTGFELLKAIASRTGGFWTPGPAAIYPALRGLERRAFVSRSREGPGRARPYTLTPAGRKSIQEWEKLRSEGRRQARTLSDLLGQL